MNKLTRYLMILLGGILVLSSCRKDVADPVEDPKIKVYLKVVNKQGNNPFLAGSTLSDGFGNNFELEGNEIHTYLSGFALNDHQFNKQLLIRGEDVSILLGEVDPGQYNSFSMAVGLDSTTNASDPATFESDHPLSYINNTYWVWATQYKFTSLKGGIDSDNDSVIDLGLVIHTGTNSLYRQKTVPVSYDLSSQESITITLEFDWLKLVDGIDLETDNNSHTTSNYALAEKVANNSIDALTLKD